MNTIFLRQQAHLSSDQIDVKTGKFKGVAYTGAVISQHGYIENLIIDLSSLSVQKEKTPALRDHMSSQVAGSGKVQVKESGVDIEGSLSKRTTHGKEIVELSEDGVDWELSLGIYGGRLREFENETINGIEISKGTVLENGVIREVSFVILGADAGTSTEVFNIQKKENLEMKLIQHGDWAKFACSCGGTKDSTPEDLQQKFEENSEAIEEKEKEIAEKQAEIDRLKSEIDALKSKEEEGAREDELSAAAKAKNIELSEDSIKKAAKTKEGTEALKLAIEGMKKQTPSADPKFKGKVDVTDPAQQDLEVDVNDAKALFKAANKMVSDGKVKTFDEALDLITKKEGQ